MDELFPLFLKLAGRPCLIVGGGVVAEAKMQGLLRCGAEVRVVASEATPGIREAAIAGRIVWDERPFLPADLAGVFLVVAATNSAELHEEIFRRCQQAGILCNAVDEPERCDFYYPAIVRRGALQLAISTAGHSPFLAQRLRHELEERFGPEYGPWLEEIGQQRRELFQADISPESRRAILKELSSERAFAEFQARENPASESAPGRVYFVGAGPGDPDLLTRKAWTVLRSADVVLHDALVPPRILSIAPAGAILCNVGKRCGAKSITQEEIHALLIGYASAAKRVVRLQGGDPLIFGRAGEEISAVREAGVDFEVIPGVTAASAAAASAQIALTDRRAASQIIFLSAHRREGELERDLKSVPRTGATLVIYMPGSNYERLARALRDAGISGETACLIVSQASAPQESIYRTDLASLTSVPAPPAPALLIVGAVAAAAKAEAPPPIVEAV
ncbi:MAG: uroporphyrinogen-III C-methyltransferase [Acidobacteria bacterium]|nr:MAG: uroporphyrinogen-III C-methyltransferase [Acidobacteriota bacterium]